VALNLRPDQALLDMGWPAGFLRYQLEHGPTPVVVEDLFASGKWDYCSNRLLAT
jgi:hypothetical protein